MTIEDITYYIEKDMEEGFYGADCDIREMAHIEVLELMKELQAHREAWMKVVSVIDQHTEIHSDGEFYIKNFDVKKIIAEYKPKESEQ